MGPQEFRSRLQSVVLQIIEALVGVNWCFILTCCILLCFCRVCEERIVSQLYLRSQMDLRPFMWLGLSRIRVFLSGLTSKKELFFGLLIKIICWKWRTIVTTRLKMVQGLGPYGNRFLSEGGETKITDAFQNPFDVGLTKKFRFPHKKFLLRFAHFFGRRSLRNVSAFEAIFVKLSVRQVCACGHRLITEKFIARREEVLARVLD